MKRLLLIIILFVFSIGLYAQHITFSEGDIPPNKVSPQDTLDFSKMRIQYKVLMVKDTLHPEKVTEDRLMLQIGSKISKSSNYYKMINDSILSQLLISGGASEAFQAMRGRQMGDLTLIGSFFKNYPTGKITALDKVLIDRFQYEENIPDFQWKLEKGEQEVLGYLCKKATTNFRGRTYEAWYAPEIMISDGPWKFSGLPGLILKISDAKKQYVFEAIALSLISWKDPITLEKSSQCMKTNRENFNRAMKRYMDNPAGAIQNSDKVTVSQKTLANLKAKPYNPIELE